MRTRRNAQQSVASNPLILCNEMRILLLIPCLILSSCDKLPWADTTGIVSESVHEFLSPGDLGIVKRRFTATPAPEQVAIFRSSHHSATDRFDHTTYDQIMWKNGEETHTDVIITPRSFYVDFPEPEIKTSENIFRDSWRLHADGYRYDINGCRFVSSNWANSSSLATGQIVYTKNSKTMSEDLKFEFRMFIVSLEEAKRIHPELKVNYKKGTTSWSAAYHVDEEAGNEANADAEPTP